MHPRSKDSVLALANATALATGVVHQVSGGEVSKTLGGHKATRKVLADLVSSRIHAKFSKHTAKATK